MSFREPRGFGRVDWPFLPRFENGTTPSYPLRAAKFLPVWTVDKHSNEPIVLPPGTFVGRLNDRDHSTSGSGNLDPTFTAEGYLAPACPVSYTVTYGANDLADAVDTGMWTPDIDADTSTAVTAAGVGATEVGIVKPCGIIARPYYAGWIQDRFDNYDPHMFQTWISGLHIVRIPCLTAGEAAIEAGDLCMLSDAATPDWNPADLYSATSTPGRLMAFNGGSYANDNEFVVGRCVNKVRLGRQASYSAGQNLRTAIGSNSRSPTNLNTTDTYLWPTGENFKIESKTEGVPGTALSATSATLGRPSELLWAYPDANGDYWAIDVLIRV